MVAVRLCGGPSDGLEWMLPRDQITIDVAQLAGDIPGEAEIATEEFVVTRTGYYKWMKGTQNPRIFEWSGWH